nr:hypothetical protein [Clavibacter michiganensis]
MSAPIDPTGAAIADPGVETSYDPELVKALMLERDISEMEISTVERPEPFRVGLVSGEVVELS